MHNSWAFYQLRLFIEYKAREAGMPLIIIDPHNTSRECPDCHTISKKNRPERSVFKCISCGLKGEADYIASLDGVKAYFIHTFKAHNSLVIYN